MSNDVSLIMPIDARAMLIRASQTPITKWDPNARIKAVEKATAKIKLKYPHLFAEDKEDAEN
jgi:hypothetical protein